MSKKIRIIIILLLSEGPALLAASQRPLILGIFPRRNLTVSLRMFQPMADYLSRKLNRKVELAVFRDFRSFWKGVESKRYDIVHYNQYHYVRSRAQYGYRVILQNEEFGRSKIAGSIVVRRDAGIRRLQDLRGKTIIFGGSKQAMISYISSTYILRKAGLKAGDYREVFALNPPNACLSAYQKQADAAGVGDKMLSLNLVRENSDVRQLRYLAVGQPLAHLPWATRGDMPAGMRIRIVSYLARLHYTMEGRAILKKAQLTRLRHAVDRDFDPHRRIIRIVTGERY